MKTPCAEIQREAAGLASLQADDPERRAAFAHADACADCAAALAEGGAVLAVMDVALRSEAPRPEALARARQRLALDEAARGHAVPARRARARPVVVASVAGVLLAEWALLTARHWTSGRGVVTSLMLALAATTISVAALRFGGISAVMLVPVLSLGSAVLGGGDAGPQPGPGARCALELALATTLLLVPLVFASRRGLVPQPEKVAPTLGAAAALNMQAVLQLGCHAEPSSLHPLAFHAAPVILLSAACFVIAKRLFSSRPRPTRIVS